MSDRSSEIHRRQLDDIAELAGVSVENLMLTLAPYPLREWAIVLRELLPDLVFMFGPAAGEIGVEYYNSRRTVLAKKMIEEDEELTDLPKFRATSAMVPEDLIREGINKSVDYFVGSVFNRLDAGALTPENPEKEAVEYLNDLPQEKIVELTEELKNVAGRDIKNFSRKTIAVAANLDPADIIPVRAVNAGGCDWCKLLHFNGSIKTAKFYDPAKDDETGHFHPGCRCTVDLSPRGDVIPPEWYSEFEEEYIDAKGEAGSTKRNPLIAQIRRARKAKEKANQEEETETA